MPVVMLGAVAEAVVADEPAPREDDEPIAIDDEMTFETAIDESPASWTSDDAANENPEPSPAVASADEAVLEERPLDPFLKLVAAIEQVALATGGAQEHVAGIRGLFGVTRWEGLDLRAEAVEALIAGNIVVEGGSRRAHGLSRTREFTEQVLAWQGILRGESEDFSLCTSLDAWAADVLARVLGSPARAEGIRRELRGHGVAAFGLIADAA
jgi:hypothetical protein